jgi:DNA-binding beta-propeller fold protein YncE
VACCVRRLALGVFFPQVVGDDFLWAPSLPADGQFTFLRVDTKTNETMVLTGFSGGPGFDGGPAATGEGMVWAPNPDDEIVVGLDPFTGAVQERIRAGGSPGAVAAGAGAVWVANVAAGTVSHYDLTTREVKTIDVGGTPNGLVVAGDAAWVAVDVR